MKTDLFKSAAMNFLWSSRDVERIISQNPHQTYVVRGGLETVLPTINCLRDLCYGGWRDFPRVSVSVPENCVTSALCNIDAQVNGGLLSLLEPVYNILDVDVKKPQDNGLVILLNEPDVIDDKPALDYFNQSLKNGCRGAVVLPTGASVPAGVTSRVPFVTGYDGSNVFFPARVEEILWDYDPAQLVLIGRDPLRLFYSAVGALDWFILRESIHENPENITPARIREMAGCVRVMTLTGGCDNNPGGTILKTALEHLRVDLGVESTGVDYRFTPVPGHRVAIDILH